MAIVHHARTRKDGPFRFAPRLLAAAVLGGVIAVAASSPSQAKDDFFRGKTIHVVVGYGSGGGYDLYARVFAEQIGKFIPGKPSVVVENMPGAGSFVAARYLYGVAPQDGTFMGVISQTFALDPLINGDDSNFDASKLPVVGRLSDSVDVGIGRPGENFKSFDDARKREIVVASTGGSSPGYLMPAALAAYGGAKFKIVSGYAGSAEAELAVQRGEADIAASVALLTVQLKHPDWVKDRTAPILYQSGLKRSPMIPWVPSLNELGTSALGTKILTTLGASAEIGKSVVTTPGLTPERLAILRKAFEDMMHDHDFQSAMRHRGIPMNYESGEKIDQLVRGVKNTSPEVIARLKKLATGH